MSIFNVEFVTIDDVPAPGRMSGPLPNTNTRKLLTPGVSVPAVFDATSAIPSAAGNIPPTFVDTDPVASPEQMSRAPEQSAKLITIDGVPAAPNAPGAGNTPMSGGVTQGGGHGLFVVDWMRQ